MAQGTSGDLLTAPPSPDWRAALPVLAGVFVATRLLVILVAALLESSIPLGYHGPTYSHAPILASLTGSDSVFLLGIAEDGYHVDPIKEDYRDVVFFPLYPLVVRLASFLTFGDLAWAGVLVANVAFGLAMAALYRLALPHIGHDGAVRSTVYLAIAPGAVAFTMAYSDSLFLLLAAGTFIAAERGRWAWAGILYGLATLTRLPGVFLGIPLAILALSGWRSSRRGHPLWLLLGPLSLVGFFAYLGVVTGDPLASLTGQSAWSDGAPNTEGGALSDERQPLVLLLIGTLILYTFLLVYLRADGIPRQHAAYAVVGTMVVLASLRLLSVGRYLAVVWPFAWVLAGRRANWFRHAWPVVSAGLFVVHAMLHFTQALAP